MRIFENWGKTTLYENLLYLYFIHPRCFLFVHTFFLFAFFQKQVMSLKIGRRLKLYYLGVKTNSRQIIKFGARLADGK